MKFIFTIAKHYNQFITKLFIDDDLLFKNSLKYQILLPINLFMLYKTLVWTVSYTIIHFPDNIFGAVPLICSFRDCNPGIKSSSA